MDSAGSAGVFRFGAFEYDPSTRELRKGRTRLRVPAQSLEILSLFLQRPGEVITREEICERLWPHGTTVEFEHSVNAAIKRLREALLDNPTTPRYIETLPKRGYRFIAAVETAGPLVPPHYRILGEVGRGAMGIVYRAEDLRLGRQVALKSLPPELASDPQRKSRLIREARAASALNHPNIVTVHDISTEGGVGFIVMEYVAGKALGELIPGRGMPPNQAIHLAVQIADALAAAHAAGIVHRDLKPGNIMVTGDGRAKLLDFGVAKVTTVDRAGTQTSEGAVIGTSGYMSPEQTEGKPVDARSDMFSFGAVLYEMVTGRRAFERDSSAATLAAVLHDHPTPPSQLVCGVPPELERVIVRCLRKTPAERFERMDEVRAALELLERELESGAAAASRWPGPRLLAAAAVLLVTAAVVGYWWIRPAGPRMDLRAAPLMSYPGWASSLSFSPDGNKFAFAWTRENENDSDIYVEQVGSGAMPVRLTSNPVAEASPAWSPDDRQIAFTRVGPAGDAVVLVRPLGGPERIIADVPAGTLGAGLSWTPDSQWVAAPVRDSPLLPHGIWLISVKTGERRRLTKTSTSVGDLYPAISPDGRILAFSREVKSFVAAPYALRLSRDLQPHGEPWPLTKESYSQVWGAAWTGDGRAIVYAGGGPRTGGLFWLRVPAGGQPVRLPYAVAGAFRPAVARTRARLAWAWSTSSVNLWRGDTRTGERKMLLGSNWEARLPQYSADGRKIAFKSNRAGDMGVWTCDADGSNCAEALSFGDSEGGTPRWSPDGRWLALDWRIEGQSEIYAVQADGGTPRRITNDPADDVTPSWSRDGRWIYFSSNRSGRMETWKTPAAGGAPVQVTRAGGGPAFESLDGEDVYYFKFAGTATEGLGSPLFRMPVRGGREQQIVPRLDDWAAFDVTRRAVYFSPDSRAIQRLEFASGKVSTVAVMEKYGGGFCVSPDDAFVVWPQRDRSTAELMVVEGFR